MAKRTKRGDERVAIAYVRVSSTKQELGPEAQSAAVEAWARGAGVRIAAVVEDRLSGATPLDKHPGFTAALAALHEHGAGLLVIARRDRLARDVVLAALAERAAQAAGARVASADGVARLEPEPGEQATLARARVLRADERSYAFIARQLAAEGRTPRSGARWHPTQVRRMLSGPEAAGARRPA